MWKRNKADCAFAKARLALQRPDHPDGTLALQLLQKHQEPDVDEMFRRTCDPQRYTNAIMGLLFFIQTARMLAKSGQLEDARWVLDLGRTWLPRYFQMDQPSPTRSHHESVNMRLATAREISLGHADRDGYLVPPDPRSFIETEKYSFGQVVNNASPNSKRLVRYIT
jgi:hypothetical protein